MIFPAYFAYLNHLQQWLYDFEIHLFKLRTTEGIVHNYYKKFKLSLMLQKGGVEFELFEFENQGKFNLFRLLENI